MDKMDFGCVSNRKEMAESTATAQKQRVDELEGVANPMATDMGQAAEDGDDMPGGMLGGGFDDASGASDDGHAILQEMIEELCRRKAVAQKATAATPTAGSA